MKATVPSRNLRRKAIAVLVAACYSNAYAAPVNPTVVAGQASFNLQGKTYTITNTPNAIINWQGFSIAADELTRFVQQGSDSKVLNRITGQDPSVILGSLQSNGKVFLVNPNGVLFGAGSRVDVAGLVASSLNISNADFLAGKNNFDGAAGAGKVSNQGTITTPSGGQIFLIAPAVENSGVISSANGVVVLAAGHSVQLFDSKDPNVQVVVSSPSDQALNLGQIVAQGGRIGVYGALVNQRGVINANSAVRGANGKIVLKASGTALVEAGSTTTATGSNLNTGGDILLLGEKVGVGGNAVVDASGESGGGTVLVGGDYQGKNAAVMNAQQAYLGKDAVIRADAISNGNGGKVVVWSDQATQVHGTISARGGAAGGNGGLVETSGHFLDMQGTVDTRAPNGAIGSLLLDPSDVYIAVDASTARAGGWNSSSELALNGSQFLETGAVKDSLLLTSVLQSALQTTDVTVSTANASGTGTGTITVLSPLLWTTSRNLALQADGNISLNSSITGINGSLSLTAGGSIVQTTSPIDALAVSNLNAIAAGDIMFDNNANTIGGTATLASSGGNVKLTAVNVNLSASNAAGTFGVTAYNGDLSVTGNVTAGANITLESSKANGTLGITSNRSVTSLDGNVNLVADKMNLLGPVSATSGHAIVLTPYQDSVNVLIGGSAADATGTLGLSETELQNISLPTNGLLQIGTSFTNPAATGTLTVTGSLDLASSMGGGGLLLQTKAGDLAINSGATLSNTGVISLQTLPTGDHRVTNAGTVSSAANINIYAGKMTLADGTLNTNAVSLSTGNQVDLGATNNPANTLALTNADINSVHAGHLDISINSVHTGTGDIVQSAPMSIAPSLTLTAQRNIDLQANLGLSDYLQLAASGTISASGSVSTSTKFELLSGNWVQNSASLPAFSAHDFMLTGGSFVRVLGGDGLINTPYQLTDVYGLQGAASLNQSNSYVLANDIDASATGYWSNHFVPIAGNGVYTGVFDGANHAISGLNIYRPGEQNVGMFSALDTGTIRNLTLSSVDVQGSANVGALVGYVTDGVGYINNVQASGQVRGIGNIGLLIGRNGGLVGFATTSGTVTGQSGYNASNIGGLIGQNVGQVSDSSSSAAINTTGDGYAGGLIGSNTKTGNFIGAVTRSYATGNVTSTGEIVGGLVGDNNGGTLTQSYASGNVNGGRNVGGLAGRNANGSTINNAYATGNVSGNSTAYNISHGNIGGLLGDLFAGSVSNVYSKGTVSQSGFFGYHGLVGAVETGSLTHGYFDGAKAGTFSDAAGGVGLTTAQMQLQSSFSGMDFNNTWRIYDGHTEPMLKAFLAPYEVGVTGGTSINKVYDGQSAVFTGSTGTLPSEIQGTLGFDNAVNVGTYSVGGLWSTKYDISYVGASALLTIEPRPITATLGAEKTYDGTAYFSGTPSYVMHNVVGSDPVGVSASVQFNNKSAGTNKPLTVSEIALTGNSLGNYTLTGAEGFGTINPAELVVSGLNVITRSYNQGVDAQLGGTPSVSPISGDSVLVSLVGSGTATFNNKNVGSGKLVAINAAASFSVSGDDAGNYVLVAPSDLTGEITPALLTVSGMTVQNRVYNLEFDPVSHSYGRKATVSGGSLSGVLGNEQVSIAGVNATFEDKTIGTAKPVTVNGVTLGGNDAANYAVVNYPTGLAADITPATLTLTLASREYNNSSAGTFSGAVLSGVLGQGQEVQDNVTLNSSGAIATYANKNVGTAKVVTVSGEPLSLGGYDAGNYVLSTNITGDITARPLATWIGTAPGAWSNYSNWADGVAPDAANVLKADLGGSGGLVTFDSAAGNVTLVTLSSSGTPLTLAGGKLTLTGSGNDYSNFGSTLTQAGGALEVQGRLRASNLVLSSGALVGNGVNSEINASALNQSGGGIIDSTGLVTVGGGNVVVGSIRAHQLTIDVGEGGTVSQTSGSQLDVGKVSVSANGNITFNNPNNHINEFDATIYGSGNIGLFNDVGSGELLLGPLTTHGNIFIDNHGAVRTVGAITAHNSGAGTGQITIAAHSPVIIGSNLIGTDIGLSASTDIVLGSGVLLDSSHSIGMTAEQGGISFANNATVNSAFSIQLTASTNIALGGTLSVASGGSISAVATNGNISTAAGTHINSNGSPVTLSAPQGSVSTAGTAFGAGTVPTITDGAAALAAQAAAEAAAKAAADAAAKAAADAAAKAAADAAAKAAADAAAKAAADAAAKAAADAAAEAAAKAAADAAAKAAADAAAAKAAADAAAKAAADAAAAKAAADAAAKAAADAAAAQGQQNQPVTQAINSTVNIINSSVNSSQTKGGTQAVPDQKVGSTAATTGSGNSAPDEKVPDEKNADGSSKTTTTAAKEQVKKMYCN